MSSYYHTTLRQYPHTPLKLVRGTSTGYQKLFNFQYYTTYYPYTLIK
ncbi:hypothetical protein PQZ66_gp76 [Klebsiella phage vB_KleM_KB2]|nr:hypothetical protein PQZ66_gp76 [Klebsiella phage vB_KleM_KB2]